MLPLLTSEQFHFLDDYLRDVAGLPGIVLIASRLDFALYQKRRTLLDILFADPGKPRAFDDDVMPFRLLWNIPSVLGFKSSLGSGQRELRYLAAILERRDPWVLPDVPLKYALIHFFVFYKLI